MADADSGMDVSGLLAPWMAQDPFDMSQYGGPGQFGASLLAASGPTPYRQPFMAALGKGMLAGQQGALANAKDRMGLASNSIMLQQNMAMMPLFMQIMRRMMPGGGAPQGAPTPDSTQTTPPPTLGAPNASAPAGAPSPGSAAPAGGAPPAAPQAPWMGGGGGDIDPMEESRLGAVLGAMGRPNTFDKDAALRLQYNPGMATSMEFAKSPVAQDMMLLNAAARAKNPDMSRMALTKLQTDMGAQHIGSMSGIRTFQEQDGSWTTINPSTGLRVNDRAGASYMPGALAAFGARENVEAAAKARGELGAETAPGGGGGGAIPPAAAPAPAPARPGVAPAAAAGPVVGHAAVTTPNYIPPILQASGNIPQRPGNTSLVALKELQEGQAKESTKTVDELQQKANDGQQLLAQVEQIRSSATQYPWTGRFADDRASYLNVLQGVGWISPEQAKELSSYQDASKISIQLQASATKQLGSREAAQVFSTMGKSIPNLTLSPDGLDKVSAYMEGVARYNQAMSVFAQRLAAQGNASGVQGVENSFVSGSNPTYYIMASASPKTRAEFLASMPAPKRAAFLTAWDKAIKNGLAPRPLDYEQQGQ